jgi:hypothetical protein
MRVRSIFALLLTCVSLQGCLVFIPGSVTGAVSDTLTGSEGSNCVGAQARVGDTIRLPGGGRGVVKSLSGTSIRCTQPEYPIRALLIFPEDNTVTVPGASEGLSCQVDSDCASGQSCRSKRGGGTECRAKTARSPLFGG